MVNKLVQDTSASFTGAFVVTLIFIAGYVYWMWIRRLK